MKNLYRLNQEIANEWMHPLKDVKMFVNGFYALRTDNRVVHGDNGTDVDLKSCMHKKSEYDDFPDLPRKMMAQGLNFYYLFSPQHKFLENASSYAVDIDLFGRDIFLVSQCESSGNFDRLFYTADDQPLFHDVHSYAFENSFNKGGTKVGFVNDAEDALLIADLAKRKIIFETKNENEYFKMAEKHKLKYETGLGYGYDPFRGVRENKSLVSDIKREYPRAVVKSKGNFVGVIDNGLFYYYDLAKPTVIPNLRDSLGRYYINNYRGIQQIINKHYIAHRK